MNIPCDAVRLHVAVVWSAATLAFFQTAVAQPTDDAFAFSRFDASTQLDLDVAYAAGDLDPDSPSFVADLRYRFEAETITSAGTRWGMRGHIAARTGDGRRGFSQNFQPAPTENGVALAGLATGFSASPTLDDGSGRIELSRAELFLKQNWVEWQLGWGPTAASQTNEAPILALRLFRADRAHADLVGGGLAHTGLSLTAPAVRIGGRSRRILGLSAAISFTPLAERCGLDICRPALNTLIAAPDIQSIVSTSVDFDRRIPSSGVRWRAFLAREWGEVQLPLHSYVDPWLVSAGASREKDGVALSVSYQTTNDGFRAGRYRAISGQLSYEADDWLYSLEIANGDHEVFQVEGSSFSAGASRWIGPNALVSGGVLAHDAGGVGAVLEMGLRF